MNVERTGWPAAVVTKMQYKMRNGRVACVAQYSISNDGNFGVNEILTGRTVADPAEIVQWTANGDCISVHPADAKISDMIRAKPDGQYDLVEAIRGGTR